MGRPVRWQVNISSVLRSSQANVYFARLWEDPLVHGDFLSLCSVKIKAILFWKPEVEGATDAFVYILTLRFKIESFCPV